MAHFARSKSYADAISSATTTVTFDEATALDGTYLLVAFVYTDVEQVAVPAGWTSRGSVSVAGLRLRILAKQGDGTTNSLTATSTNPNTIHQVSLLAFPGYSSTATHGVSNFASGTGTALVAPAYTAATTVANLINIAYAVKNAAGGYNSWDSAHDTVTAGDRMSLGVAAFTTSGQNPTPGTSWANSATYRGGQLTFPGTSANTGGGDTTAPVISSFTATPGNGQVALAWSATDNTAVTRYVVTRGGTTIYDGTATSFTDTGLTNGTSYSYVLTAYDAVPNTSMANASATPTAGATVPGAPTGLTATPASGQVALTWTAPASNGGSAITDYLVEYQPSGGSWTTFADGTSTTPSATVTGLTNGTAYAFRVSAINAVGTSSPSTTASATPAAASAGTIAPSDSNLLFSPYQWDVTAARAMTVNSGAYLRAAFTGALTGLTATFDTAGFSGSVTLWYRVDDGPWTSAAYAASVPLTIPSNNWTSHTVELLVQRVNGTNRWTTPTAAVKFTGFTVAPTTITTRLHRRRPYNILAFGDSLLEGYGTVANGVTDARFGWGLGLRDHLGAEIGCVGINAIGLTKSGESGVPAVPTSYNQLYDGKARSFTTPAQPNLIVINLGTNDNGADIVSAATAVLNGLLAATTTTKIAVVQQWNGTLNRTAWQTAIAACTAPARVTYIDTTGWLSTADTPDNVHPYGYANTTDLTPRLAAALQPLLTGTAAFTPRRFVRRAGAWTPIG